MKNTLVILLIFLFSNTIFAASISLQVISAGYDTSGYPGGVARLYVDGVDYSKNGRGINIVVIDKTYGNVVSSVVFDTYLSTTASANMVTFINNIAAGNIVIAAVKDEATDNITSTAINALKTLGASSFAPGYRGSWAFIGEKGLAAGAGLQDTDPRYGAASTLSKTVELMIPEPGTYFLCLISLVFVTYHRKKRNK